MTANPYVVAKSGSFDEFVLSQGNSNFEPSDLLYRSMANRSPPDRVRIANLLLDQGANASFSEPFSKTNCLHILFSQEAHDFIAEAPVLKRLLDGGADINQQSPKWGVPLKMLYENLALDEPDLKPFYDVIFSHPGINFDVPITMKGAPVRRTLRDMAAANAWNKREFGRRMLAYEAERAQGE